MTVRIAAPSVEHHRVPLGIGESAPRLSWIVEEAPAGWAQHAYEFEIERDGVTETVVAASDDQILVEWPVAPLASRERAAIRVRLADGDGVWSDWSAATVVEAGLLDPADWTAKPVGAAWDEDPESDDRRPSLVRREFHVADGLVSARLYATAHGLYEAEVNGARVGDDTLSPGWTVYPKRLRYYTYDVTDLIEPGANAIGAWLGDGWYRGRLGWRGGFRNLFGDDLSFLGQLELTYADGHRETVATDAAWKAAPSPILRTGIYDGEDYDARLEPTGWSLPGFDDDGWDRRRRPRPRPAHARRPDRSPGALHRGGAARRGADLPDRRPHPRLRPEPRRARPHPRRGPRRRHRAHPHRPRCCRTARSTPGPCAKPARPTTTRSPAAPAARSGSRGSRSTASATPRSTAGPATSTPPRPPATWSPGSTTPTSSAPDGSNPPIRS